MINPLLAASAVLILAISFLTALISFGIAKLHSFEFEPEFQTAATSSLLSSFCNAATSWSFNSVNFIFILACHDLVLKGSLL
jgi:hypothetical protein